MTKMRGGKRRQKGKGKEGRERRGVARDNEDFVHHGVRRKHFVGFSVLEH
jgi:hypothetical protein